MFTIGTYTLTEEDESGEWQVWDNYPDSLAAVFPTRDEAIAWATVESGVFPAGINAQTERGLFSGLSARLRERYS